MDEHHVLCNLAFEPGQPLWQRVPTHDPEGQLLTDFMMLIPGLQQWPEVRRQQALTELQRAFVRLEGRVIFADLNLKLNLLWVSMRPHPGGCVDVAALVREFVPEAILVASQAEAMASPERRSGPRWRRGLKWLREL